MTLFDVIIVGSGPAGTFAAYALRDRKVLMLDVGYAPPSCRDLDGNIFRLRREVPDLFGPLIGEHFESLHNLHKRPISLKLKAPFLSYIVRNWQSLSPVISDDFGGVMSFAKGGLANAWGAGVYRFNNRDLQGFPISASDLEPFYDLISAHIGISGSHDDLVPFFGHDRELQPPMKLSRFAAGLLRRYENRRSYFNGQGISIGYPRLALLTCDHNGRTAYQYQNLEFFKPVIPALYNPAYTLNEMIAAGELLYRSGCLVESYREEPSFVEVRAKNLECGSVETFRARKLILAAGALGSSKIVLQSHQDFQTRLPFLDNPMAVMPLLQPGSIGAGLETESSSLTQLNIVYDGPLADDILQASVYGTSGPLRTDVLFDLPMPVSGNLKVMKYLAQSAGAVMLFYPGRHHADNYLQLTDNNALELHSRDEAPGPVEALLIRAFRKMGYMSAAFLTQRPKIGSGLHFAGMLPMKERPGMYETDRTGLLFGSRSVFIADGAAFSALPSKNLTYTIMANAMRIAHLLKSNLKS